MARPFPSDTERPKGVIEIKEIQPGQFQIFFTPPKEALRYPSQAPNEYKKRVFEIDRGKQRLTIYPYRVWDNMGPMVARYYKLKKISIDIGLSKNYSFEEEEDIEGFLEMELPSVFTKDFHYGLGFRKDYRHIVDMLEKMNIKHLHVAHFDPTQIYADRKEAVINVRDLELMAKHLDRITVRARKVANDLKHKKVNELLQEILSKHTTGNNNTGVQPDISTLIGASNRFTPGGATKKEEKEALEVIRVNSQKIQKDHPGELVKLRNDIETVTLQDLIIRFRGMLEKDLTEIHWQRMLEENPFILSMAFGTPIVKIQGQAYVGGRRISGAGDKIADFLFKNSTTNNATIIEIKKPKAELLGTRAYRGQVFPPSPELVASVNQVLDQIYQFQKNIAQIKDSSRITNLETYSVIGILIIGKSLSQVDQQKSFELYRGNSKSIQIVTFDELLGKLEILLEFLNPKNPYPTDWATNLKPDPDDLPF